MVPINVETSKGILRVKSEVLIERLIKQLHETGISDIVVIVGFMKESLLIAISSLAIFIFKKILFQKSSFLLGTWFQIAKRMSLLTESTANMNW